jgi:hypothetical protein
VQVRRFFFCGNHGILEHLNAFVYLTKPRVEIGLVLHKLGILRIFENIIPGLGEESDLTRQRIPPFPESFHLQLMAGYALIVLTGKFFDALVQSSNPLIGIRTLVLNQLTQFAVVAIVL